MSSTVMTDAELLQQLCGEQNEDTTDSLTRFADLFLPSLTSEEQWISFVVSQRGVDYIRDFFLRSYESHHVQWYLNKPLAKNATEMTVLHIEVRDKRYAVLSLLLKLGGMLLQLQYSIKVASCVCVRGYHSTSSARARYEVTYACGR